jgi:Fe-S oxidoreductase
MVIEPLPGFQVIRDLVIDRDSYFEDLHVLDLDLERSDPYPGFPETIDSTEMDGMSEMAGCLECLLCNSACPAYNSKFIGPAPLVQLAKYALDPRDHGNRPQAAIQVGGIDDCVSCYQCTLVCPMKIPVFEMAIEGLRQQIREGHLERPLSLRDRIFANICDFAKFGSATAPISNWVLGLLPVRWLLEKTIQLDRRRKLPKFTRVPFDSWMRQRKKPVTASKQVILFDDTFTNYMEPEIGVATTELLEAAGFEVLLVNGLKCCGRPMLSKGLIDDARTNAEHNIELLAPYAERGIPIVGCEPSCLLTLRIEYPKLVSSETAKVVAEQCYTLEEFLTIQHDNGDLGLKFTNEHRKFLLHGHCHQKALVGIEPLKTSLKLPEKFEVSEIPSTCCGMAGSNGYECEHYDQSIRAAEVTLFPAVREAGPEVEIIASGFSCRAQIAHGTERRARHPALVLRDALTNGRESS